MRILVINGPNINLLGLREPGIYGSDSFSDLKKLLVQTGLDLGVEIRHFQSNSEGDIVTAIQEALGLYQGIVINPAAYTHTSIAILDALAAVGLPTVEVHISRVSEREDFRQISYVSQYAEKKIEGLGISGYRKAISYLVEKGKHEGTDNR